MKVWTLTEFGIEDIITVEETKTLVYKRKQDAVDKIYEVIKWFQEKDNSNGWYLKRDHDFKHNETYFILSDHWGEKFGYVIRQTIIR